MKVTAAFSALSDNVLTVLRSIMLCPTSASETQEEFSSEIAIHFAGPKGLDKPNPPSLMTQEQSSLCETLKRLGYAQNNQVKLYGEVFDLVSDPVSVGNNFVYVDALERKTGRPRRVGIPLTIVHMAKQELRAA